MVNNSLHPSACFRISCLAAARQLAARPAIRKQALCASHYFTQKEAETELMLAFRSLYLGEDRIVSELGQMSTLYCPTARQTIYNAAVYVCGTIKEF